MRNMLKETKLTSMTTASTAGTTTFYSTDQSATLGVLDMQGFESIAFLGTFDFASGAVCKINLRHGDSSGTLADCNLTTGYAGTTGTTGIQNGQVILLDVYRPAKRFVGYGCVRGTANTTLDSMVAVQYNGLWAPTATTGMLKYAQIQTPTSS
jgi:hypothetical protein